VRVGTGEYLSVEDERIRQQLSAGIDGLWGFALSIFNASLATRGPLTDVSANEDDGFMAKEELLTIEGVVDEILPDGRFGVLLDNQRRIIAYTAGKMRRYRIRSIVGDRVHVEMTPYDLSKGRIVYREKLPGQSSGPRRGFRR